MMDLMDLFFIFLIFVGLVGFIIQPLFKRSVSIPAESDELELLKLKKRIIYRQIKELEMDYEIGNLNQDDYLLTRNELKREVAKVIKKIKSYSRKG